MCVLRVLIVDDEPLVCRFLRALRWQEHQCECVGEAHSGEEAIQLVHKLRPDIVVADIVMPGLNGLELVARVKALDSRIQIILLTMHRDFGYVVDALHHGVVEYLIKDVSDPSELFAAIEKARNVLVQSARAQSYQREEALRVQASDGLKELTGKALRWVRFYVDANSPPALPYTRAYQWLEKMECFSFIHPLSEYEWIVLGESSDDAIITRCRQMAYSGFALPPVFSSVFSYSSEEALKRAYACLNQRFYDQDITIASDPRYVSTFDFREQMLWRNRFHAMVMQNTSDEQAFMDELLGACRNAFIAPEYVKSMLVTCVQACSGANSHSITLCAQIRSAVSAVETVMLIRRFVLHMRLMPNRPIICAEIQRAAQYIRDHLAENLILSDIARHAGLSPSYFSALFKEQMKEGVKKYIVRMRMEKATELLIDTRLRINEIARATGFVSARYFADAFLKYYGCSPYAYREKH